MTAPLAFMLPDPCKVCLGPVIYSGRGRRPVACSPECRVELRRRYAVDTRTASTAARAARAERDDAVAALLARDAAEETVANLFPELAGTIHRRQRTRAALAAQERKLAADERAEEADRFWELLDKLATFDAYADSMTSGPDDPAPLVELQAQPDGSLRWNDATATPRAKDPAALWLAQHHPTELATFPTA